MLRYIRLGTLLLAALQAYGIALGLEGIGRLVPEPGPLFRLTTVLTLVAGAPFLMWLGGQDTARRHGDGTGIALILAAGIIRTAPANLAGLLELSRKGAVSTGAVIEVVLGFAVLTVVVALVERSRRRLPVVFAERRTGMQRQTADIALKLNPTGLMPVYIVGMVFTIVLLLVTLASLLWATPLNVTVSVPVRLLITAVLIVFFTFVYTAFVCDPE